MNKKITILALLVILVLTASFFYLTDMKKNIDTNKTVSDEDAQLIDNVIKLEKNLVLLQTRGISFDDFKKITSSFFHSYYSDSYFDDLEKWQDDPAYAASIIPVNEYISKAYSDNNETYKKVFIKIPIEGSTSQIAKKYIFKKDNGEWKIFSTATYLLSVKNSKKRIEEFTNFNETLIEYEYIKILE